MTSTEPSRKFLVVEAAKFAAEKIQDRWNRQPSPPSSPGWTPQYGWGNERNVTFHLALGFMQASAHVGPEAITFEYPYSSTKRDQRKLDCFIDTESCWYASETKISYSLDVFNPDRGYTSLDREAVYGILVDLVKVASFRPKHALSREGLSIFAHLFMTKTIDDAKSLAGGDILKTMCDKESGEQHDFKQPAERILYTSKRKEKEIEHPHPFFEKSVGMECLFKKEIEIPESVILEYAKKGKDLGKCYFQLVKMRLNE